MQNPTNEPGLHDVPVDGDCASASHVRNNEDREVDSMLDSLLGRVFAQNDEVDDGPAAAAAVPAVADLVGRLEDVQEGIRDPALKAEVHGFLDLARRRATALLNRFRATPQDLARVPAAEDLEVDFEDLHTFMLNPDPEALFEAGRERNRSPEDSQ